MQGWSVDPDGAVPYQFVAGPAAIGKGSLQFGPVDGGIPANKFIMFAPFTGLASDLASFSYEFFIGGAGAATDAQHFYANVYVDDSLNGIGFFGSSIVSTGFYDCRFDLVPASGAVSGWTTASFTQSGSWTNVADRTGACPSTLDDLTAGSLVRWISLNGGQSTSSDAGLSGAFDNVVISATSGTTTYDFEPEPYSPPENPGKGNKNWLYYGDISAAKWDKRVGYRMGSICPSGYPACLSDDSFTYAGVWSWHQNGKPLSDLTHLSVYYWMDNEVCVGGSPRFSIFVDTDGDGDLSDGYSVVWAYLGGQYPQTCSTDAWTWSGNLLGASDTHFDVSGDVGYRYNQTWAQVLTLLASQEVYGIAFDVDSGWSIEQAMFADDVRVNDNTFDNLQKGVLFP